jgi:hypothetical protein
MGCVWGISKQRRYLAELGNVVKDLEAGFSWYVAFRFAKMRSFAERTATCTENRPQESLTASPVEGAPDFDLPIGRLDLHGYAK